MTDERIPGRRPEVGEGYLRRMSEEWGHRLTMPPLDCPFCQRIERGMYKSADIPGSIGTPRTACFEPLNPVTPGHMLFLPSAHIEHPSVNAVGVTMAAAERWGEQQDEPFNLITSSGVVATQSIAHIHVHYVPRREDDGLHLPWTGQITQED